ncbi:MAG: hypothetical protein M1836_004359 [Candelina mexicana]|nr:MAG: hypothetical protein M1836_004359 [Candelina mexicana]
MAPAKKRKRNNEWDQNHLLTNPSSKLGEVNLFKVLNQPEAWNSLTQEEQASLLALSPPSLVQSLYDDGSPQLRVEHPEFRHALHVFQGDLTAGRLDPKWLAKAADAMEARGRGEFDAYHETQRILAFGETSERGIDDERSPGHGAVAQNEYGLAVNSTQGTASGSGLENGLDRVASAEQFGVPQHHNEFTDMHGHGAELEFASGDAQTAQDTSTPSGSVELYSKLKLDVLVRGGCFEVGDVLLLRFKYTGPEGEFATKEATILGWNKNGTLSISYPPGLNLTSPAADGRPDHTATNLTGPIMIAAAMLKGDDGKPIGRGGGWKDFTIRNAFGTTGTLWRIRQGFHGWRQTFDRREALPGVKATRPRRTPQKLKDLGYRWRYGVFEYVHPVTKEIMWADPSVLDPDLPKEGGEVKPEGDQAHSAHDSLPAFEDQE